MRNPQDTPRASTMNALNAMPLPDEVGSHPDSLKNYIRAKQQIAYEIRALSEFLGRNFGETGPEECRELMAKLAEDRFTLAVVGQFKRGKSSLMNAIIGQDLLPTGVLPLTSAITVLRYGPGEKLTIHRHRSSLAEEAPVGRLADYVTEQGNPSNIKDVAKAVLEVPLPFLRGGLEFVDTPGIGSAIEANTLTTYSFLPKSDAVIFVTSADTPLTRVEIDFLNRIRDHVRKIFFVVNKIDLAGDKERDEVLRFVQTTLENETGSDDIRLFPISSALALAAKQQGDSSGYASSGIGVFEEELSKFLSTEKSATFLGAILDKVSRLQARTAKQVELTRIAFESSRRQSGVQVAELQERFQTLKDVRRELLTRVQERAADRIKAIASARIESFLEEEIRKIDDQLTGLQGLPFWKPTLHAVKRSLDTVLPWLQQDFMDWANREVQELNPQFLQILRVEWINLEQQLQLIPEEAARVLGASLWEELRSERESELPLSWILQQPGRIELKPNLKISLSHALLPGGIQRGWLQTRLRAQLLECLVSGTKRVKKGFERSLGEAMKRLSLELETRAGAMELRFLEAMNGRKLQRGIDGQWRSTELDETELLRQARELMTIEKRLGAIYDQLHHPRFTAHRSFDRNLGLTMHGPAEVELPAMGPSALDEMVIQASRDKPSLDFRTRGCPVCDCMVKVAFDFFSQWQFALATHENAQKSYAASLGFCPLHTWQLAKIAAPHGLSQGYPVLMDRLSAELTQLRSGGTDTGATILTLVKDARSCHVCRLVQECQKNSLEELASFLETPEGRRTYASSQGICLPHLAMLGKGPASHETISFLVAEASRRFSEIAEDMRSYVMKRDARRGHTQNRDEEDAWVRGLIHNVGARQVSSAWDLET